MLPYSKSALKQHFYAKIKLEATTIMRKSPRYALLNSIHAFKDIFNVHAPAVPEELLNVFLAESHGACIVGEVESVCVWAMSE